MEKINYSKIAQNARISRQFLTNILAGRRRSSWSVSKRLAAAVPGSTPEQWLEAPPETLRQIINEYAQQERTAS